MSGEAPRLSSPKAVPLCGEAWKVPLEMQGGLWLWSGSLDKMLGNRLSIAGTGEGLPPQCEPPGKLMMLFLIGKIHLLSIRSSRKTIVVLWSIHLKGNGTCFLAPSSTGPKFWVCAEQFHVYWPIMYKVRVGETDSPPPQTASQNEVRLSRVKKHGNHWTALIPSLFSLVLLCSFNDFF